MATFSPKKNVISKRNCCVPQCDTTATKNRECSFHTFPKGGEFASITNGFGQKESVDRRAQWIRALCIGKNVSKAMCVCSMHFQKNDYILSGYGSKNKHLKKGSIPTQNLPVVSCPATWIQKKAIGDARRERCANRSIQLVTAPSAPPVHTQAEDNSDAASQNEADQGTDAAEMLLYFATAAHCTPTAPTNECATQAGPSFKNTRDVGTQVTSGDFTTNFATVITTERKLRIATGLPNFLLLNVIVQLFTELSPESNRHSMNNKTKVLLTFVKLKLNWSFVILSIMFGGTAATCSNVFKSTLLTLLRTLEFMVYWPSKAEVMVNMPKCFEKYKKVRVVLDCTEIGTHKTKCMKCRIMTYSHYKGGQTIKYLIGVSPAGMITYLSKGYGGRASDKAMFMDSGLIDLVDSHVDDFMVDRGFLIDDICSQFGIGLICPPFLRKKTKFSREEALATCDIARARVHVERVIERVKKFKLVSERIPWKLVGLADEIMLLLCAIVNLSSPILADDKFV